MGAFLGTKVAAAYSLFMLLLAKIRLPLYGIALIVLALVLSVFWVIVPFGSISLGMILLVPLIVFGPWIVWRLAN